MGVLNLNGYLTGRGGPIQAYSQPPSDVGTLVIELNQIFHTARTSVYESVDITGKSADFLRGQFYAKVTNLIEETVRDFSGLLALVLVTDGIAPVAKMTQQRSRRIATTPSTADIDRSSITPGTELMIELDTYIQQWITTNRQRLPIRVIYSSHLETGEGEHKIFDYIRQGLIPTNLPIMIQSLDADMYMLGIASRAANLFLYRRDYKENKLTIVSIDAVVAWVKREFISRNPISDFVFMMSLWGNDFVPHQVAFTRLNDFMDYLKTSYAECVKLSSVFSLIDPTTNQLDVANLTMFFEQLSQFEKDGLYQTAQRNFKYPLDILEEVTTETQQQGQSRLNKKVDYGKFKGLWQRRAFSYADPDILFDSQQLNPILIDATARYVTMLHWVYQYYTRGTQAVNVTCFYPHHYVPMISQCAVALTYKILPAMQDYFTVNVYRDPSQPEINIYFQLAAVIPAHNSRGLPYLIRDMFDPTTRLEMFSPDQVKVDIYNTDNEHGDEGIKLLPFLHVEYFWKLVYDYLVSKAGEEGYNDLLLALDPRPVTVMDRADFSDFLTGVPRRGGRGRGGSRGRDRGGQNGEYRGRGSGEYRGRGSGEFRGRGRGGQRGGSDEPRRGRGRGGQRGRGRGGQSGAPRGDRGRGRGGQREGDYRPASSRGTYRPTNK